MAFCSTHVLLAASAAVGLGEVGIAIKSPNYIGNSGKRKQHVVFSPRTHPGRQRASPATYKPEPLRPSRWKSATTSHRSGDHMSVDEKVCILAKWGQLPTDPITGKKLGVNALCDDHGITPAYLRDSIINVPLAGGSLQRKIRSDKGKPRKFIPSVMQAMEAKAEEWEYEFTYQEMADFLKTLEENGVVCSYSHTGVKDAMEFHGWNTHYSIRLKPTLEKKHRQQRVKFCTEHLQQDWVQWVDIDEKWFYTDKAYLHAKVPAGKKPKGRTVHHKSHIPKV